MEVGQGPTWGCSANGKKKRLFALSVQIHDEILMKVT
jgi:hypothetical protein